MKKNKICGSAAFLFGLLIALGPQFLFKVHSDAAFSCYWAARAEIAAGILIAAAGICLIFFSDVKIQLGLTFVLFLAGIAAGFIPQEIFFGVCKDTSMECHRVTLPALTVICSLLVIGAFFYMIILEKKTRT